MLEILVLHGGEALQVQLHPHVEPGREAGRVQRVLLKVFGDHVAVRAVLLAHPLQQQLLVHRLLRVLLEVLQDEVQRGHVVIRPVHVLDGDVTGELGEGLKKLGEGEVVFMRHRLRILKELLCKKIAVLRIRDVYPGSRIPDLGSKNSNKRER